MRRYGRTGLALLFAIACSAWAAPGASAAGSPAAAGWGANEAGQLGDATTAASLEPTPVHGLSAITAIAAGKDHSLALLSSGHVMAWGDNASGELGNGSETSSDVPVEVKGITTAVAVAAGAEFSLALLANGTVLAWGQNKEGELGNGNIVSSEVPETVLGLSEVKAIAAGAKHALALLNSGKVMAWGADSDGQLGNGTTAAGEIEPGQVSSITTAKAIAAGGFSSYAVLSNGDAEAWGDNAKGQLGIGSTTNTDTPAPVKGLFGAQSVSAGENHALALVTGGTVYAWGNGIHGELGNGTETSSDEPIQVTSLSEATAVAAGANFSLALLASGAVDSWGADNEGQLGNGTTTGTDTPQAIPNLAEVKGIAAGGLYALSIGPALPAVTGVQPGEGPAAGGTAVTITGTGFNAVKSVHFGSVAASTYTVESETTIHATAPAGSGIVDVSVTVPGGTSPATPADHFSYAPVVTGVSPASGPQTGGTDVVISGQNLTGVSAVAFGSNAATSFKDISATEVKAVAPAGVGTVDVTLTGPGGVSEAVAADDFTYGSSAPELGRCEKLGGKKHGAQPASSELWSNAGCTEASSEGKFEWLPGAGIKHAFKLKARSILFETAAGAFVACKSAKGAGEYSGARALEDLTLKLKGCTEGHTKCTTAGSAKEGEISSATLVGEFGLIEKGLSASENEIGLDLSSASVAPLLEFKCGSVVHTWRGSVIAPVKANKMEKAMTFNFQAAKSHQKVERFEGKSIDVPESSTGAGAYEQGAIVMSLELKGESEIEINSVH